MRMTIVRKLSRERAWARDITEMNEICRSRYALLQKNHSL